MRRIGVLMPTAAGDPQSQARLAGFLQGLQEFGWTADRNMRIDYRWAGDDVERRRSAAELVALAPDVLLASTPTRSGRDSLRAWRGRAATRLGLLFTNTVSAQSGWSWSKRSRPAGRAWPCFANPPYLSRAENWAQSRAQHRRCG